jgi:hypothetical protein
MEAKNMKKYILGVLIALCLVLPSISAFEVNTFEVGSKYITDTQDTKPYYTVSGPLGGGLSWKAADLTTSSGYLEVGYYQPVVSSTKTGVVPYYGVTSDSKTVGVAAVQPITDDFTFLAAGQSTLSDDSWSEAGAFIGKQKVADNLSIKGTAIVSDAKPVYKLGLEYKWD